MDCADSSLYCHEARKCALILQNETRLGNGASTFVTDSQSIIRNLKIGEEGLKKLVFPIKE
jgi:hypothetical protein